MCMIMGLECVWGLGESSNFQLVGGPPSHRADQKTRYGFIMVCTDLPATGQNSLTHGKERIWLSWLSKNSRHTHQNCLKSSPVSERSAYPLQNYVCFSPLTSGLDSFGHKSTPSHRPCIEAYSPKF